MKIPKSLYNVFQYFSTIYDPFAYLGNGVMVVNDPIGSGFVEVKAPDYFFKEKFIIRSMSKFLRLFAYDRKDKAQDPVSIQDWTLGSTMSHDSLNVLPEMYIDSPQRHIKLTQGSERFIEANQKALVPRFDNITLRDSIKFQLTSALYKQIISDCSLLSLDTITISSENEDTILILLTKADKGLKEDYSAFRIECPHTHCSTKIQFLLSAFILIEATDHQLEFGKFDNKYGTVSNVLKIRSFCDNNFTVNRVILGKNGD